MHHRLALTVALLFFLGTFATSCRTASPSLDVARTDPPTETPSCKNDRLTSYPALLVFAPHPDDEVLGFAGLIDAYLQQGKPVKIVVTTDGDAYCVACRFWKTSSFESTMCSERDLRNFETPEIDSFAEIRRSESTAASALFGLPAPMFLGYPDTGLGAAWRNIRSNALDRPLRRSDFSNCADCESPCGYGGGSETALTAKTLLDSLRREIETAPEGALLATTHWLDGHGDHAGLGSIVRKLNDELAPAGQHPMVFAVIHAHTPKTTDHPDCWYPAPAAPECPCMDEHRALADPGRVARLASHRFRPESPGALPDDAHYGSELQFCLPERLYRGEDALKRRAVLMFASQLGHLARDGSHPEGLEGIVDCNGYLLAFIRSTEPFVLVDPRAGR
ncbi:MAG: PIG-L family deacetylase [Acidobacteria bacterium]|nr:PIG-L family deacetylase [Acidobacteriota bacterium]